MHTHFLLCKCERAAQQRPKVDAETATAAKVAVVDVGVGEESVLSGKQMGALQGVGKKALAMT